MPKSKSFTNLGSSLDALADLRQHLAEDRRKEEEAMRLAEKAKLEAEKEANLFREFVKDVKPITQNQKQYVAPAKPPPVPKFFHQESDDEVSSLSDLWEGKELSQAEDEFHFRRNGVSANTLSKLKKGEWRVQAEIDLHGYTTDEAREAIFIFIKSCSERQLRCVRVIHGKGLSSIDKEPVLKRKTVHWLAQLQKVTAFCPASEKDGGNGALMVLLKAPKPQRDRSRRHRHDNKPN